MDKRIKGQSILEYTIILAAIIAAIIVGARVIGQRVQGSFDQAGNVISTAANDFSSVYNGSGSTTGGGTTGGGTTGSWQ